MKNKNDEMKYHGNTIRAPYFEGWYYKVTDAHLAFACIIGIAKNEQEQHGFIQTIDTLTKTTQYYRYEMDEVKIEETPFSIRINENYFSSNQLILNLPNLQVNVQLEKITPLHRSFYAPSIMGPFAYIKNMQCVHSIVSLHHLVKGSIYIDHQSIKLNGIGYMEKDRGVSFPKEYIWVQSNACDTPNTCFFLSIAHIPISKIAFTGCICVLMVGHQQVRFATYNGVKIQQMDLKQYEDYKEVNITLVQWFDCLKITIRQFHAYPLLAPQSGVMEPKVFESLDAQADVTLYHRGKQQAQYHFKQAGCEIRWNK